MFKPVHGRSETLPLAKTSVFGTTVFPQVSRTLLVKIFYRLPTCMALPSLVRMLKQLPRVALRRAHKTFVRFLIAKTSLGPHVVVRASRLIRQLVLRAKGHIRPSISQGQRVTLTHFSIDEHPSYSSLHFIQNRRFRRPTTVPSRRLLACTGQPVFTLIDIKPQGLNRHRRWATYLLCSSHRIFTLTSRPRTWCPSSALRKKPRAQSPPS